MIKITKGKEPDELLQYRKQKFSSYSGMQSEIKKKILESLLAEQGNLCAYCMCRISDEEGENRATIEHCKPQSVFPEKSLDYKNMVAVCSGNRENHIEKDMTCDAKKGNQLLKVIDVFDERTLDIIAYKSDGTIFSENSDADEDLDLRLNLNCPARQLKECRKAALIKMQATIAQNFKGKTAPKQYFEKLLCEILHKKEKIPFCGILIWWLKRKIG